MNRKFGSGRFFSVLYLWFTAHIVPEGADLNGELVLSHKGGLRQAAYRYGGMSVAALVMQGLLFILSSAVVPFLDPEGGKATQACLKMAIASTLLIMAITVSALVVGWPHSGH